MHLRRSMTYCLVIYQFNVFTNIMHWFSLNCQWLRSICHWACVWMCVGAWLLFLRASCLRGHWSCWRPSVWSPSGCRSSAKSCVHVDASSLSGSQSPSYCSVSTPTSSSRFTSSNRSASLRTAAFTTNSGISSSTFGTGSMRCWEILFLSSSSSAEIASLSLRL